MSQSELNALLIENLADIEAALRHLDKLDEEIFRSIDSLVEEWANANAEDWVGEFNFSDKKMLWLAPKRWEVESGNSKKLYKAKFELLIDDPDLDQFYITYLCQAGEGTMSFYCRPVLEGLDMKLGIWKKRVREEAGSLSAVGLTVNASGEILRQVKVYGPKLANSIREGAVEDALEDFHMVLNQLNTALPTIEKLF